MDLEFTPRVPAVYSYVYPSSKDTKAHTATAPTTTAAAVNNNNNNKPSVSNNNNNNHVGYGYFDYDNIKPKNNQRAEVDETAEALLQQLFGISLPPSHRGGQQHQQHQQQHQPQQQYYHQYQPQQQQQVKPRYQVVQQQQVPAKPVAQQPQQQYQSKQQPQPQQQQPNIIKPITTFSPKVDILNGSDSYLIRVELAGVEKKDLSIDIKKEQILSISGEKKDPFKQQQQSSSLPINIISSPPSTTTSEPLIQEASNSNNSSSSLSNSSSSLSSSSSTYKYNSQESLYGKFTREVQLPSDTDITQITATHENGILLITIPKQQELTPQSFRINIQ
ncbi:hypothetical protein DFA_10672 [Cavenderia fasciculata]|uniref:SHSP domain-containing protein n=1 Tax=Cavenderia fasciculata TaxID=261658 RepID=F4QB27_CACFS|nr:uncharacterized protein DFA_10672 [Cavenderia fasciculata]EGG14799.1 hypothetical protein DFA_10672 [Cavenderia fasciculata]|eukprot:XP_004351315.1 hypothetical protein DFA_10672 [Cavenderia fasciculata]